MPSVAGYTFAEPLIEDGHAAIHRARRDADGEPVLIKTLTAEYPDLRDVARLQREYALLKRIDAGGVAKALDLGRSGNSPAMILDDFGGEPLRRVLARDPLRFARDLPAALDLARGVARALGELHAARIVHRNIKPESVFWHPETGQVRLVDLGIAAALPRGNQGIKSANVLEGTLAYISPEQTGRMNRAVDCRSDFYSAGVMLYELFTGGLPFDAADPMELVHGHIAKTPAPPHEIASGVPPTVSAVILKLMAKTAEDRYQSAYGLASDLAECAKRLSSGAGEPFLLGRDDVSDRFQIPQRLYGREAELEGLLAVFDRASSGRSELALLTGSSGVGKSALVQEIYGRIAGRRGYFITGKYDQVRRNTPYSAVVAAFRDAVRQLLAESRARLAHWRERILGTVGPNGQVIIDVIPEVELIIGPQPPLPALSPAEAQNRFHEVFRSFIGAFCRPEHPLVIFLDDIQWADAASLGLIQLLMTSTEGRHLLLIGAYRDDEVNAAHPLSSTVDEIQKAGGTVSRAAVVPLDLGSVARLIADTIGWTPERSEPLAELVLAKTNGNPFFLSEFLKSLYAEELIRFDAALRSWEVDLARVQALDITDNVVDVMVRKIQRLPPTTQEALKRAACIGNRFDAQALGYTLEISGGEAAAALEGAVAEGLVLPLTEIQAPISRRARVDPGWSLEFKFAHDRIQQAAYSLMPEAERRGVHLGIGRQLLKSTPEGRREEKIFEIVDQIILGLDLPRQELSAEDLAELMLSAGKRAKASVAHAAGLNYLRAGLDVVGEAGWAQSPGLTLALHLEAAEAAYLSGDFEHMDRLTGAVLSKARTALDRARAYEIQIQACVNRRALLDAVKLSIAALRLLGVDLPERPGRAHVLVGFAAVKLACAGKSIDAIADLPAMTDPALRAAMRLLMRCFSAAYIVSPMLMPLVAFKMMTLSLKHGVTPETAYACAMYGTILGGAFGETEAGFRFGQLALRLVERFDARALRARTAYLVQSLVFPWTKPLRETQRRLSETYQVALDVGDFEFAAWVVCSDCLVSHLAGRDLAEIEREIAAYADGFARLNQALALDMQRINTQFVSNLTRPTAAPWRLKGESYDEDEMLRVSQEAGTISLLGIYYVSKLMLCYLFERYDLAIESAERMEPCLESLIGSPTVALFGFYDSLARLSGYAAADAATRRRISRKVARNQKKLSGFARHAPMNYLHKVRLVEAERCRVGERDGDAFAHYQAAIALAKEHEYLNEEALARELCGRYWLGRRKPRIGADFLREARYCYQRWGATTKVTHLEEKYPSLFAAPPAARPPAVTSTTQSTTQSDAPALDVHSLMKSAQTISGEIVWGRLVGKLLMVVLENAGAERGDLLLERDGELFVEAHAAANRAEASNQGPIALAASTTLPRSIVEYAARTREGVVLDDATADPRFASDPYVSERRPRSVLCAPILHQGKLTAVLYLENRRTAGAFTPARLEVLTMLSAQAAISIDNARLYETLEERVRVRTRDLSVKNDELESALGQLKEAQRQLVEKERLAALGAMTAAIAHEIKSPLGSINGLAETSLASVGELLAEIDSLARALGAGPVEALRHIAGDIKLAAAKIDEHGKRADRTLVAMGDHAAFGTGARQEVDLNHLVAEHVVLAYQGLRARDAALEVTIETSYDSAVGAVSVPPEDFGRVILNLVINACQETLAKQKQVQGDYTPTIRVSSRAQDGRVEVRVRDNGRGIPASIQDRVFNPFFTTKPPGEGTGLGLSIAHDIVVRRLGGELRFETEVGSYTEFIVSAPRG